jgi:uncharacterized repeat protein (TIGR01451 family)
MQKLYVLAALVAVGLGIAGWSTLGSAQPGDLPVVPDQFNDPLAPPKLPEPEFPTKKPTKSEDNAPVRPVPKARPADDPFVDPLPVIPTPPAAKAPTKEPIRILDQEPVEVPKIPAVKTPEVKIPDVKEPVVKVPLTKDPMVPVRLPGLEKAEPIKPNATKSNEEKFASTPSISKQEPSVALEWMGPSALRVGVPAEYALTIRNTCAISVQKVVVQVRVPTGVKLQSTEPKAEGTEGVLLWDLGTLTTKQEKVLKIKFLPPAKGDISCQAWVTFTGSSALKVQVREPKLMVKAQAPEKALVGEAANVVLTVSNPGDFPADQIKLNVALGEGLESARGNKASFDLGSLAGGESRQVTIPCVAKVAGKHKCEATVEGDDGLKANDTLNITVIQPSIDLEVTGPKLRYLDKKGTYTFKVTNPSEASATNVFVTEVIPAGFKFVTADQGGQHDFATRTVKWFIGELGAGQSKEVKAELLATDTGDFTHKINVSGARGIKADKEHSTKVEGVSALLMEVVDTDDPIEVKTETTYEVRITNTGSKFETDVKLACTIPAQMKFKSASGPVKHTIVGNDIVFETIPKLAQRADATFKITVVGSVKGDARFKAMLTSGGLTQPVIKEESTRVYSE